MFKMNKIISTVVLACFLFNTAISDLAFGQIVNFKPNVDKLAVPLMCDDLVGIERKDMGRIKLELEALLIWNAIPINNIKAKEKPSSALPICNSSSVNLSK